MANEPTDKEIELLKGLARPFGAGNLTDEEIAPLLQKGFIKQKGAGLLVRTPAGEKAARKK